MKFYMLDGNEKILCAVPSKDIISLYQNLNYHQADTIEGSLVLSEKYTSILNNVRYFAISDRESNHNFYLYRKTLVQVQNHEIAINGQGAFWDEMQGAYIKDRRPNQVTPADTIKLILGYSRWNVDYVDQMLEEESLRRDMNFYYVSLLDALNTVYQTWQVDIEPYINIEGHQITRRYVKLYQQQGGNNGRRFVYGDNALTVTQQANEGSIFTALVGRGAGVEETDADGNLTGGYSRKINFADVEWSKANGDPCDKPKGQEYVEWKESTELYGYSDGKPRIGIVNFDNEKDPAQLLKETWAQLQQVGVPLVQFQATVGDVGYLNLGETVTIVRYDLNIKYQTRVTGIKWNRCDEAKSQITIGVKAIQSTADKIAGLQQSVAQANVNADEAKSTANHAIIDGTGAVVNYGPNEPTNPKEGDIWYDVQPDGTVVLKQYQNGQWVILIDDTTGQQIKNKVEAQQKELDKAVQDANAASAKADGLVAQVGDANTNAQKALTTAQQNQADLAQAKNQLSNVQSDLTSEKSTLSSAISDISQTKQRLSDLTTQAQTQGQTIANIQKTQSGLTTDIADVKGNVSSLQDTANGLQATVADNKNNISSLKQTAQGLESTVSNMRVGGTNLLRNTKMMNGSYWFSQQSPIQSYYQGIGVIHVASDWWNVRYNYPSLVTDGIPNNTNDVFTFSCLVKKSDKNSNGNISFFCGAVNVLSTHIDQSAINADYWTQIWVTFKFKPSSEINVSDNYGNSMRFEQGGSVGTMLYTMFKLEKGSMPTAYSPAPQDTDDSISSISQKADSIQSTVQGNTGQISQVKQTADSLQSSITQGIGSYLPNGDFADSNISKYWVPWDTTKDLSEVFVVESQGTKDMPAAYLKIQTKSSENKTDIGTKDFIPFNINEPIEIKAWSWLNASNGNTQFQFYIHCYDENHNEVDSGSGYFKYDNLNEWELTDVTFGKDQWNKNTVSMRLEIVLFGGGIDTAGYITGLKIINGSSGIASEFTQTIDSLTSKIADADGNISQLKQTSDSLTSQIGNANNDISSLKQRADSMESNISDNENNISDLRQTANSLQSNIQSKADISQITQLSNAIQSVVQSVGSFFPNGNFADSNVQVYWSPWDVTKDYTNINYDAATYNGSFGNLLLHASGGGWTKAISTEYIPVQPNKSVTVSLASRGDWYDSNGKPQLLQCYVHFYDSKKNATESGYFDLNCSNNQQWYDNSTTYDCNSNECYIRVEIVLQGNQENWAHITNVKVSSDGGESISSKISQMADDINMRVQKGDLLSQINIEAGSTLIQSKKLFLDASSVVFSGNAFIPSAAITDLSADKITAGTLNAGNVNIINLDVNKLVGNTTEFVRSGWTNAYGSHVQIDGGGMAVTYGDWYTRFDGNGMTFKDGNEVLGGFTRVGMVSAPSWYNGLGFNAGGDAEFLSIGAQDYGNDSQNPVPVKLLWMRQGINTYGYQPGWNFCDDVWMNKLAVNSFHYGNWDIKFGLISGSNGYSALTLTNGSGGGFFWGSDGGFGFAAGGHLYDMRGKPLINEVGSNGVAQSWTNINY